MIRHFAIFTLFAILLAPAFAAAPDPMSEVQPIALLRADQFDKLEEYYAYYFKNYDPKKVRSYEPVEEALGGIGYASDLLPHLDKWVAAKPASHVARLTRGHFYIGHAWAARGSGFANTVTREGWKLFGERLAKADADLTSATQLNPSSPFPYVHMITIDMGASRGIESAAKHFIKARTIDPSFYPVYSSFIGMNQPRWGGSHEIMRQFAQNNADRVPGSLLPLLWVAYHEDMADDMYEGKAWWKKPGNWEQVDAVFKKVIPGEKQPNWLRRWYGNIAVHAGRLDVAREQYDLIGTDWSSSLSSDWIFWYIGSAWPGQNAYEWMLKKANAELQKDPRSSRALRMRGLSLAKLGRDKEAIADLKPLQVSPLAGEYRFELAQCLFNQKQYADALETLNTYLLSETEDNNAMALKADALCALGRTDEAISYLENQIQSRYAMPQTYYSLAVAYLNKRKFQEAVDRGRTGLERANELKYEGNKLKLNWVIASGYSELKQPDKAFPYYVDALKAEENDFMLNTFEYLYRNGGIWEPYRDRIVKALQTDYHGSNTARRDQIVASLKAAPAADHPTQATAAAKYNEAKKCYEAAWQCASNQDFKKGIEYSRKSIALLNRPWAPAYAQLGCLLIADGQKEEAKKALEQALQIDPKDPMALSVMKSFGK